MVKITLDPKYKGPELLQGYVKKGKSQSSMSRMLGLFNKRYLTLDMKQLLFFYGASENSNFQKAKIIRLQSINRIMIDPNLDFLPPKETWRWGFIINTNEKNYRFMFNDKNLFDGFLFAFSCIYRSDTNKPLYEIHIPELIYGDLPHDQHQMPLKTQPDLPNIIQTEIQDPLSMNASPNNQMASQLGTQGINMYRQEPSNDKEEERINHNSPELNQNANHTNQDTNQQKDETVNPPQKQFARRNSFFDNNAPNPSTSTVTMNSNPTTVINKDPEIPKPPKKTKSKPVEQPPEENKKTFEKESFKYKDELEEIREVKRLEPTVTYPMSNRTREIKDEIESPDDGHEIIMEKVHYKPRLGSMDDEDETFGKQSRTYFNAKQNNQNQFNLYGIDEIEDKKLKKPGDDLIENFRPNSGGRKKDIFDDPPKKYEPSQFDTTKSSSGQKAKSGWDDDLEQDSPDPWDKKQVSPSKPKFVEDKKSLWDDDEETFQPEKEVKPINNNYSQNIKPISQPPVTQNIQKKPAEEDDDDWDKDISYSPQKKPTSKPDYSYQPPKETQSYLPPKNNTPQKPEPLNTKPTNISPPESKPAFKRPFHVTSTKEIKTVQQEVPPKKTEKVDEGILDDWD